MRIAAVLLLGLTATAAAGAPPPATLSGAPKLPPSWEQTTREIFKASVELPTVAGRNQAPALADYLAGKLRVAGWSDRDLHLPRYEPVAGNPTAALIAP